MYMYKHICHIIGLVITLIRYQTFILFRVFYFLIINGLLHDLHSARGILNHKTSGNHNAVLNLFIKLTGLRHKAFLKHP